MDRMILDTDVFSYLLKHDTRAAWYRDQIGQATSCLSFITVAELKRWALAHSWGVQRRRLLEAAIADTVVLPFDSAMADHWATVMVHRSKIGRPIECGDCWIAAAALHHGLALLSHNAKHYESIPSLQVISRPVG
jgi:predicted nucleic acid-binding protein